MTLCERQCLLRRYISAHASMAGFCTKLMDDGRMQEAVTAIELVRNYNGVIAQIERSGLCDGRGGCGVEVDSQ